MTVTTKPEVGVDDWVATLHSAVQCRIWADRRERCRVDHTPLGKEQERGGLEDRRIARGQGDMSSQDPCGESTDTEASTPRRRALRITWPATHDADGSEV